MDFTLFNYSQKRLLSATVVSLLAGYMLSVTNIPRGVISQALGLKYYRLNSNNIHEWTLETQNNKVETNIFLVLNLSICVGAALGSLLWIFIFEVLGFVRSIVLVYTLFIFGSLFCMFLSISMCLTGRFLCGVGIGIAFLIIPRYIKAVTGRQNQNLYSTLHNTMFCCGILIGNIIGWIVPNISAFLINLSLTFFFKSSDSFEDATSDLSHLYYNILEILEFETKITDKQTTMKLLPILQYIQQSFLSVILLFGVPFIVSFVMVLIWFYNFLEETPEFYIERDDLRSAETAARNIHGVENATIIVDNLRKQLNEYKKDRHINIYTILFFFPIRRIILLLPIVACSEILTGFFSCIIYSGVIFTQAQLPSALIPRCVTLVDCFLIIFTLTGTFFASYIAKRRLLFIGLASILLSLLPVSLLPFFSAGKYKFPNLVVVCVIALVSSSGFGVSPVCSIFIKYCIPVQLQHKILPILSIFYWISATISIVIIELLPLFLSMLIFTSLSFLVLASYSIMNFQDPKLLVKQFTRDKLEQIETLLG
ncbi:major facilitator superfamily protein [Cryptosporidium serpentis]